MTIYGQNKLNLTTRLLLKPFDTEPVFHIAGPGAVELSGAQVKNWLVKFHMFSDTCEAFHWEKILDFSPSRLAEKASERILTYLKSTHKMFLFQNQLLM